MKPLGRLHLILIVVTASRAVAAPGAPAAGTPPLSIEVALTGSLGYDNNVYLVDQGPLGRVHSLVSTVGAKVGAKFASGASASYAATGSRFWDASDEDNVKHQLAAGFKPELLSWGR